MGLLRKLLCKIRSGEQKRERARPPAQTDGEQRKCARLDAELEQYRSVYRDGPVGVWRSCHDLNIGIGFDGTGLSGDRIEFRADGTGDHQSWGVMCPDDHLTFRWTSTGPCRIEIVVLDELPLSEGEGEGDSAEEEWRVEVVYEFFAVPELGTILMRDASPSAQDSFWMVQCPVQLERCP